MSLVAGIDLSTHSIDCAFVDEDTGDLADLGRWALVDGKTAFDRTRHIRDVLPTRQWWTDSGVVAVGIENPGGKVGAVRHIARVQGAVLACLPVDVKVVTLEPAGWRKLVGLHGHASKEQVREHAHGLLGRRFVHQDSADALCIAVATRVLLEVESAAA